MSTDYKRIQYLTAKAERNAISPEERSELAGLLGRNPENFEDENDLQTLIGLALLVIAIALIAGLIARR